MDSQGRELMNTQHLAMYAQVALGVYLVEMLHLESCINMPSVGRQEKTAFHTQGKAGVIVWKSNSSSGKFCRISGILDLWSDELTHLSGWETDGRTWFVRRYTYFFVADTRKVINVLQSSSDKIWEENNHGITLTWKLLRYERERIEQKQRKFPDCWLGDKYLAVLAMKTNDKLIIFIKSLNQSFPG